MTKTVTFAVQQALPNAKFKKNKKQRWLQYDEPKADYMWVLGRMKEFKEIMPDFEYRIVRLTSKTTRTILRFK